MHASAYATAKLLLSTGGLRKVQYTTNHSGEITKYCTHGLIRSSRKNNSIASKFQSVVMSVEAPAPAEEAPAEKEAPAAEPVHQGPAACPMLSKLYGSKRPPMHIGDGVHLSAVVAGCWPSEDPEVRPPMRPRHDAREPSPRCRFSGMGQVPLGWQKARQVRCDEASRDSLHAGAPQAELGSPASRDRGSSPTSL